MLVHAINFLVAIYYAIHVALFNIVCLDALSVMASYLRQLTITGGTPTAATAIKNNGINDPPMIKTQPTAKQYNGVPRRGKAHYYNKGGSKNEHIAPVALRPVPGIQCAMM